MTGLVDIKSTFQLLPMEKVLSGAGCVASLAGLLAGHNVSRALLVTGRTLGASPYLDRIREAAGGRIAGVFAETVQHVHRPAVLAAAEAARAIGADAVISFGGGSPNDTAKGVLLALAEDIRSEADFDRHMIEFRYPDHLVVPEMRGRALPMFAIPTTLSAGEFTHFIGITDPVRQVKDLTIDRQLTAKAVILDPELTLATPEWLWLSSGMRAVDHCIEALQSITAHPFTDALGAHALGLLYRHLPASKADPSNVAIRTQLQIAAWMSVAGLANVTLGLSHGIGHQLGARLDVPHGHTSCVMMHHTMRFNRSHASRRQAWIAQLLGVDVRNLSDEQAAISAADAVEQFTRELGLPTRLRDVGVTPHDFAGIAADAMLDMIVATNPRPVRSEAEVVGLLEMAW